MATRKDLLKAESFVKRRMIASMVSRDPDQPQPGLRRATIGSLVGVLIAALALAIFGIIGVLNPGANSDWKNPNTVVIDKSSGLSYVVLDADNKLYPTYNVASARLLAGNGPAAPKVVQVDGRSLRDYPRQRMIGIPAAPASLPHPDDMSAFPLRVCNGAGAVAQRSLTVEVGAAYPAARQRAIFVVVGTTAQYLIWDGIAHPVQARPGSVGDNPLQVSETWLKAVPVGSAINQLVIPAEGEPSAITPGGGASNVVGSVVATGAVDNRTYYVLLKSGYARISWVDGEILALTRSVQSVDQAVVSANLGETRVLNPAGIPLERPQVPQANSDLRESSVCAVWTSTGAPAITIGEPTPAVAGAPRSATTGLADVVVVAPGHGAIVQPETQTDPAGVSFLLVDGHRYGIPDLDARAWLGYQSKPAVQKIPAAVLGLISDGLPPGVALSKAAADTRGA